MGAVFDIDHINLVGYLTSGNITKPLRTERSNVLNFLTSLAYGQNLISSTKKNSDKWAETVSTIAEKILSEINKSYKFGSSEDIIDAKKYLHRIKGKFDDFNFYALIIPGNDTYESSELYKFFVDSAISSGSDGLILFPSNSRRESLSQFVDPFPALIEFSKNPIQTPAVIFWSSNNSSCALPLKKAAKFFREILLPATAGGKDNIDKAIKSASSSKDTSRILHLSDLHLGSPFSYERRSYMKMHLRKVLPQADRVVITGDLFDSPNADFRSSFDDLRRDFEALVDKSILVVPGNHDSRIHGNSFGPIGKSSGELIDLVWEPLSIDDDMGAVFFSFDSSEEGNSARGGVSEKQRLNRALMYDEELYKNPTIDKYIKIALVHHHPVKYDSEPETAYGKILRKFWPYDALTAFNKSEEFIEWCLKRNVNLILHGHKHIPRIKNISENLTIVGCGSSIGARNTPMSYDLISINKENKVASVSFYDDEKGDGGGFEVKNISVDLRSKD